MKINFLRARINFLRAEIYFLRAQIVLYRSLLNARSNENRVLLPKKKASCCTACSLNERSAHKLIASDAEILHEIAVTGQRVEHGDLPVPVQAT